MIFHLVINILLNIIIYNSSSKKKFHKKNIYYRYGKKIKQIIIKFIKIFLNKKIKINLKVIFFLKKSEYFNFF